MRGRGGALAALPTRARWIVGLTLAIAAGGWMVSHDVLLPALDDEIVRWVAEHRPGWLVDGARVVTDLGWFRLLVAVTAGAGIVLAVAGRARDAWRPLTALMLAATIGPFLKNELDRPRPAQELWAAFAPGSGYPSGHSAQAAAAWLALAFVLAAGWPARRTVVLVAAVAVVGAVGASRVILGVHSPSDVLAGWALGAACALLLAPRASGRR